MMGVMGICAVKLYCNDSPECSCTVEGSGLVWLVSVLSQCSSGN